MKSTVLILNLFAALSFCAAAQAQNTLTIEQAIALSADRSPAISSARSDSIAAAADLGAARALRFPSASLNATTFYISELQSLDLPFASIEAGVHNNYQADLRLTLPLYTGGRISNQVRMQSALTRSRGLGLQAQRLGNVYMARKAYLGVLAARASEASAEASLNRLRLIGQDVQNLFASGLADSADLLETDLSLARGQQLSEERRTASHNALSSLARLLGIDPNLVPDLVDAVPFPDSSRLNALFSERLDRPELKSLAEKALAARFAAGAARAAYFPSLSGYGGYSVGKPNRSLFDAKWNDYWTAGLNLNWEFNLGGRSILAVSSANELAISAQAAKSDMEESLTLQAAIARENLILAYNSYVITGKEFAIAQKQYQMGLGKQLAGNISTNRLLELEADLSSMEQLYKVSVINYFVAETEYLYAIGSPKIFGGL